MIPEADELSEWDRDQKHSSQYSHSKTLKLQHQTLATTNKSDSDSDDHKLMAQTIKTDKEKQYEPFSKFVFNEGDPNIPSQRQLDEQYQFKQVQEPKSATSLVLQQQKQRLKKDRSSVDRSPGRDIEFLLQRIQEEEVRAQKELEAKASAKKLEELVEEMRQEQKGLDMRGRQKRDCCKKIDVAATQESPFRQPSNFELQKQTYLRNSSTYFQPYVNNTLKVSPSLMTSSRNILTEGRNRTPTPQKVMAQFKKRAMQYQVGRPYLNKDMPREKPLPPEDPMLDDEPELRKLMAYCKKEWGFESDQLYNPMHQVTYELYVKNASRTVAALLSQRTIKPVKIDLAERKQTKKMKIMVTTLHQNKFRLTKKGFGNGYGSPPRKRIHDEGLQSLINRGSPEVRNLKFGQHRQDEMERILSDFVPEVRKRSPIPVTSNDQLVLSCRRKQSYDQNGMPILVTRVSDGGLTITQNQPTHWLNEKSTIRFDSQPASNLVSQLSLDQTNRYTSIASEDCEDDSVLKQKKIAKKRVKKEMFFDDMSQWHQKMEKSMQKFKQAEEAPEPRLDILMALERNETLNRFAQGKNILDGVSDSDEEKGDRDEEESALRSVFDAGEKPQPTETSEEQEVQVQMPTKPSGSPSRRDAFTMRLQHPHGKDESVMENEGDKQFYTANLIDIKEKWQSLGKAIEQVQSTWNPMQELHQVIAKPIKVEGRKQVSVRPHYKSPTITSSGPSMASMQTLTQKRSPFVKQSAKNHGGKKMLISPLATYKEVLGRDKDISAPQIHGMVTPQGGSISKHAIIENSIRRLHSIKRLVPEIPLENAPQNWKQRGRKKNLNLNSSVFGSSPSKQSTLKKKQPQSPSFAVLQSQSNLNGPSTNRLLKHKENSNQKLMTNQDSPSWKRGLPQLRVVEDYHQKSKNSLELRKSTRNQYPTNVTAMHEKDRTLALKEIYQCGEAKRYLRNTKRNLTFDGAYQTNPVKNEPITFPVAPSIQRNEDLSKLTQGSVDIESLLEQRQRPTFEQVLAMEQSRNYTGGSSRGMDLGKTFNSFCEPSTAQGDRANLTNQTTVRASSMDEDIVKCGDGFFPNNISTALVQQGISYGGNGDRSPFQNDLKKQLDPFNLMLAEMNQNHSQRDNFDVKISVQSNWKDGSQTKKNYEIDEAGMATKSTFQQVRKPEINKQDYDPERVRNRILEIRNKVKKQTNPTLRDDGSYATIMSRQKSYHQSLVETQQLKGSGDSQTISTRGITLPDFISKAFMPAQHTDDFTCASQFDQAARLAQASQTMQGPGFQTVGQDGFPSPASLIDQDSLRATYTFRQFSKDRELRKTNYVLPSLKRHISHVNNS